jgi:hypothetical protein
MSPTPPVDSKGAKYKIGENVRFSWYQGQILSGVILQIKPRWLRLPKYRVAYGVGDWGYKTSDSNEWVEEKDIFPGDIQLVQGKANK